MNSSRRGGAGADQHILSCELAPALFYISITRRIKHWRPLPGPDPRTSSGGAPSTRTGSEPAKRARDPEPAKGGRRAVLAPWLSRATALHNTARLYGFLRVGQHLGFVTGHEHRGPHRTQAGPAPLYSCLWHTCSANATRQSLRRRRQRRVQLVITGSTGRCRPP